MKRITLLAFLLAAPALVLSACSDDDTPSDTDPPAGEAFSIPFGAVLGDADFESGACIEGLGANNASAAFYDLRFYVADVEAQNSEGAWIPFAKDARPWQSEGVTLIDLADSEEESGTAGMNNHLLGALPDGEYQRLRFTVGVPAAQNHSVYASAPSPLNIGSMAWSWQAGRKFMRLDGKECGDALEGAPASVTLHLGSTQCEGEIGDIVRCEYDNRVSVELDWTIGDSITLDLDSLLQDSVFPGFCMAGAGDIGCEPFFTALGLDFVSEDELLPSDPQRVFYASDRQIEPFTSDASGGNNDDGGGHHHH